MNVATVLEISNGKVSRAVISPGSVMPLPGRVAEAEELLNGNIPSEDLFINAGRKVGDVMVEKSGVRWSTEYKKPVIQTMVKRALSESYSRCL